MVARNLLLLVLVSTFLVANSYKIKKDSTDAPTVGPTTVGPTTVGPTTVGPEFNTSVKPETYSCKDMFFNDCHYPPGLTAHIYTQNIEDCNAICQDYVEFDSCSFYKYYEVDYLIENCEIYAGEKLDNFIKSCNLIGLPIMDSEGTCSVNRCPVFK